MTCSGFTLSLAYAIGNELDSVIAAFIGGMVYGLFPLSFIFMPLVRTYKMKPAFMYCFGGQLVAVVGIVLINPFAATTGSVVLFAWGGFFLGLIVTMIWGPKYMVYRYATCPGCQYNLERLPKSIVCPECGRDNTDLVEMFADFELQKSTTRSRAWENQDSQSTQVS